MDADWRSELGSILKRPEPSKSDEVVRSELERFVAEVVLPAFEDLSRELERYGRQASIRPAATSAALLVMFEGEEEMTFRVQGRMFPGGMLPFADVRCRERKGLRLLRNEVMLRSGNPADYTLKDVTRDEVIRAFLDQYKRRVLADKP